MVVVSSGVGYRTGDAADDGSDHRSLTVAGCGSDQGSGSSAASDNSDGPAIMTAVIVVAVIVTASTVSGRVALAVAVAAILSIAIAVVALMVVADVSVLIVVPVTVTAVGGRLILHSSAVVSVVISLRRHRWDSRANQGRNDVDRCELLNAFHNRLRL